MDLFRKRRRKGEQKLVHTRISGCVPLTLARTAEKTRECTDGRKERCKARVQGGALIHGDHHAGACMHIGAYGQSCLGAALYRWKNSNTRSYGEGPDLTYWQSLESVFALGLLILPICLLLVSPGLGALILATWLEERARLKSFARNG